MKSYAWLQTKAVSPLHVRGVSVTGNGTFAQNELELWSSDWHLLFSGGPWVTLMSQKSSSWQVTFITHCSSSSDTCSSSAVSIHSALPPVRPRAFWAGSDPDKLPHIQAALSSALNISHYFSPHSPQEASGLSANAGVTAAFHLQGHDVGSSEGHSCRIIT